MTGIRFHRSIVTVLAVLTLLLPGGLAVADEDVQKVIKIQKRVQCEGEDCEDAHAMFVDEEGETTLLDGDGYRWIGEDGEHRVIKIAGLGGGKGGFLGVGLTDLTLELRSHFGVPEDSGVMVSKVVEDSPASRAGLQVGDIITLVDGESVASGSALAHAIGGLEDGTATTLEVWRDGRVETITATVEERERPGKMLGFMPGGHMGPHGKRMRMHHGVGDGSGAKVIEIRCDSDTEECEAMHGDHDFDCGGAEECQVEVRCEEGECICTVNGEDVDCAGIPGVPSD